MSASLHNSYYALHHVAAELNDTWSGARLAACYSQSKNELVTTWLLHDEPVHMKVLVGAQLQCLSFPANQHRTRGNSVDLFDSLLGCSLLQAEVVPEERALRLQLTRGRSLVIKLFGQKANVLVTDQAEVVQLFRSRLADDMQWQPKEPAPLQDRKELFLAGHLSPKEAFPTLSKAQLHSLQAEARLPTLWQQLEALHQRLLSADRFGICYQEDTPALRLADDSCEEQFDSITQALTVFYGAFLGAASLARARQQALSSRLREAKQAQSYISKTRKELDKLENQQGHQHTADLIMAHLHAIPKGADQATVTDFYTGQEVVVKLKPTLSPQDYAGQLYQKAKNQHRQVDVLQRNLATKENRLQQLEGELAAIRTSHDLKWLRSLAAQPTSQEQVSSPFHLFHYEGYTLRVGKHAKGNDELLRTHTHKNDLWLHAKDVPGSHVVIALGDKPAPPPHVLEYAAGVAAHYSKRKTDTLCPVIYTQAKYVRKRKGAPAGQVTVEREQVILVPPQKP